MKLHGETLSLYPNYNYESLDSFLQELLQHEMKNQNNNNNEDNDNDGNNENEIETKNNTTTPTISIRHLSLSCLSFSATKQMQQIIDCLLWIQNKTNNTTNHQNHTKLTMIQKLTIQCCDAPSSVWSLLFQTLCDSLQELSWHKVDIIIDDNDNGSNSDSCFDWISKMNSLQTLTIHSSNYSTQQALQQQYHVKKILDRLQKSANCHENDNNATLKELILDGCLLNDEATIQSLIQYLKRQSFLTNSATTALSSSNDANKNKIKKNSMDGLQVLSLKCCRLNERQMTAIFDCISKYAVQLRHLNLMGNQLYSIVSCKNDDNHQRNRRQQPVPIIVQSLSKCLVFLKTLDLSYQFSPPPMPSLRSSRNNNNNTTTNNNNDTSTIIMRVSTIVAEAILLLAATLDDITTTTCIPLQRLRLAGNSLNDKDLIPLVAALTKLQSQQEQGLESLDLSSNHITIKGLERLLHPVIVMTHRSSLSSSSPLKHVNLKYNLFLDFPKTWAWHMQNNYTLECLEHSCFSTSNNDSDSGDESAIATTTTTTTTRNSEGVTSLSASTRSSSNDNALSFVDRENVSCDHGHYAKQIAFLCELNKSGRKLLPCMTTTSTSSTTMQRLWPLVLEKCNPATIFHLLQDGGPNLWES